MVLLVVSMAVGSFGGRVLAGRIHEVLVDPASPPSYDPRGLELGVVYALEQLRAWNEKDGSTPLQLSTDSSSLLAAATAVAATSDARGALLSAAMCAQARRRFGSGSRSTPSFSPSHPGPPAHASQALQEPLPPRFVVAEERAPPLPPRPFSSSPDQLWIVDFEAAGAMA